MPLSLLSSSLPLSLPLPSSLSLVVLLVVAVVSAGRRGAKLVLNSRTARSGTGVQDNTKRLLVSVLKRLLLKADHLGGPQGQ